LEKSTTKKIHNVRCDDGTDTSMAQRRLHIRRSRMLGCQGLNYASCSFFFSGRPGPVTLCDRFWRSTHSEDWGLRQHRERFSTESGKDKARDYLVTHSLTHTHTHTHTRARARARASIFNRSMKFMFIKKEKQNYAEPEILNFKEGI